MSCKKKAQNNKDKVIILKHVLRCKSLLFIKSNLNHYVLFELKNKHINNEVYKYSVSALLLLLMFIIELDLDIQYELNIGM